MRLILAAIAMLIRMAPLSAQPDTIPSHRDTSVIRAGSRWFVPTVGGYVRSPFGFAIELGVRGGVWLYDDIAGLSAEAGFVTGSPDASTFGAHSLRLEARPIPLGALRRIMLHVERRFFGGPLANNSTFGFGFMYQVSEERSSLEGYFRHSRAVTLSVAKGLNANGRTARRDPSLAALVQDDYVAYLVAEQRCH